MISLIAHSLFSLFFSLTGKSSNNNRGIVRIMGGRKERPSWCSMNQAQTVGTSRRKTPNLLS